jgi:hypothetical protein
MANELVYIDPANPGLTTLYTYLLAQGNVVKVADGSLLTPLNTTNLGLAKIALSDTGHAGVYFGSVPAYSWAAMQQAAGSPAFGDNALGNAATLNWDGTAEAAITGIPAAVLAAAVDGAPVGTILAVLKALQSGKSSFTDHGDGTATVVFFKGDGTTPILTIVYSIATGARSSVTFG